MRNKANRLVNEKSPYLLQHANNPVDWYPWGDEAFERAKREDKPIFLSIGYSTCHWCHVMERESFEDSKVADMLNDTFVCVKVDREERPDIDHVYMTVAQVMTGSGGWPLTIIMTPEKKPFFAATYIPRENRFGMTGMLELVSKIGQLWRTRREELLESADNVLDTLLEFSQPIEGKELGKDVLDTAYKILEATFDDLHGGFGRAPKFPSPHNLLFLLRYWKRFGQKRALEMVDKTLMAMRAGGIYDHIGFGFHRYSTDSEWFVPHFEKMLYDQAMLAIAYLEAFQATGREEHARTAKEVLAYVLRDMTSVEGSFYSAEDADSEGVEGRFYLWTFKDIETALGKEEAGLFKEMYGVHADGNLTSDLGHENQRGNLLHMTSSLKSIASRYSITEEHLWTLVASSLERLRIIREKRVHPHKDDKVLVDWNGLMIAALAKAYQILGDEKYLISAKRAADFILDRMKTEDGRLLHRFREEEALIGGNLDDYAFFVWGLIELYEASFHIRYLKEAINFNNTMLERFWDAEHGGLFFTSDESEELLTRHIKSYDGAIPSGNSVAFTNLLRLGRIVGDERLDVLAAELIARFSGNVSKHPMAHTYMLTGLIFAIGPTHEVVIVGGIGESDTGRLISALRKRYLPNKVILQVTLGEDGSEISSVAPFVREFTTIDNKATAYVCTNHRCILPTTDANKMLENLQIAA